MHRKTPSHCARCCLLNRHDISSCKESHTEHLEQLWVPQSHVVNIFFFFFRIARMCGSRLRQSQLRGTSQLSDCSFCMKKEGEEIADKTNLEMQTSNQIQNGIRAVTCDMETFSFSLNSWAMLRINPRPQPVRPFRGQLSSASILQ